MELKNWAAFICATGSFFQVVFCCHAREREIAPDLYRPLNTLSQAEECKLARRHTGDRRTLAFNCSLKSLVSGPLSLSGGENKGAEAACRQEKVRCSGERTVETDVCDGTAGLHQASRSCTASVALVKQCSDAILGLMDTASSKLSCNLAPLMHGQFEAEFRRLSAADQDRRGAGLERAKAHIRAVQQVTTPACLELKEQCPVFFKTVFALE